jgi:hypothetical protein
MQIERLGVCVVCDTKGAIHYDARFDAEVCDVCDAMLTIRDDEFRRAHPEHDAMIRAIWRERGRRENARAIGLWYYETGYWDEQEQLDGYALPSSWSDDVDLQEGSDVAENTRDD